MSLKNLMIGIALCMSVFVGTKTAFGQSDGGRKYLPPSDDCYEQCEVILQNELTYIQDSYDKLLAAYNACAQWYTNPVDIASCQSDFAPALAAFDFYGKVARAFDQYQHCVDTCNPVE